MSQYDYDSWVDLRAFLNTLFLDPVNENSAFYVIRRQIEVADLRKSSPWTQGFLRPRKWKSPEEHAQAVEKARNQAIDDWNHFQETFMYFVKTDWTNKVGGNVGFDFNTKIRNIYILFRDLQIPLDIQRGRCKTAITKIDGLYSSREDWKNMIHEFFYWMDNLRLAA